MANEYLKRTPTSTGNRKVWTWSGWVKRNQVIRESYFSAGDSTANSFGFDFDSSNLSSPWIYDYSSGFDWQIKATQQLRDCGNFFHCLVSYNTTSSTAADRVNVYINGSKISDFSIETYPSINYQGYVNDVVNHTLGAYITPSLYSKAEFTDVFLVDGQALTPDVFGFYKEGKGYVSAGSTQSTDFRPGQWVPKAPRTIKSEINRRGGFGVNGFYLPMNDSSNFGADFHTTPNSIITLKGEDLPQPRNGAPDTTDAYVSQLREDPYKDYLVYAVPGIELKNTNPELVTNGDFSNGTTGWTGLSGGSLSVEDGKLKITETTGAVDAYACNSTAITTEIGKRYTIKWTFHEGSNTSFTVRFGNSGNQTQEYQSNTGANGYGSYPDPGTYSFTFTATATTLNLSFIVNQASSYGYVSNVSVKEALAVRDYSADIKGSGTNKTITANKLAGVYTNVPSYYGSALQFDGDNYTDYIETPHSTDFNFGSGDFTVECWRYLDALTTGSTYVAKYDGTVAGSDWYLGGQADGRESFYYYDATTVFTLDASAGTATVGQWDHIAACRKGNQISLFVNGVCVATAEHTISLNDNTEVVRSGADASGNYQMNGRLQDIRVYKGVAKYTGGFDVPKPYTPVGIGTWRAVPDTTANNFATLSPLSYQTTGTYGSSVPALTNGNLTYTHGQTGQWERSNASFGVGEGKWYFECKVVTRPVTGNTENWAVGVRESDSSLFYQCTDGFEDLGDHVYWIDAGTAKIVSNQDRSAGSTSGITAIANGDIINIAFEKTSTVLKVWFGVNGAYFNSGNPGAGTSPAVNHSTTTEFIIPALSFYQYSGQEEPVATVNFGQNPTFSGNTTAGTYADSNGKGLFKYQPPSGFLALCEDNLPTPAIADPGDYFKTVLWTGDGGSKSITGVGFKPDLVWLKDRSVNRWHSVFDSIRGAGYRLFTNDTGGDNFSSTSLTSFDDDGFSLGSLLTNNGSGETYVAWCWKAGGAATANTDGTITSQVSANQTAGFSIVSYTATGSAATVGHGLGKNPGMIIIKSRDSADTWPVWHKSFSSATDDLLQLEKTVAVATISNYWNSSAPNTTTFGLAGGSYAHNLSGDRMIAYCWAEIEGFSKFGTFEANGNSDGPFVYLGFKPAFLLCKNIDATEAWLMKDSSRQPTNPNEGFLLANSSGAENFSVGNDVDFLSNGFKIRTTNNPNTSGGTYIFAAFAESPFTTANAK